jgi:hypothetical protein
MSALSLPDPDEQTLTRRGWQLRSVPEGDNRQRGRRLRSSRKETGAKYKKWPLIKPSFVAAYEP